jgi:hypothetical protein
MPSDQRLEGGADSRHVLTRVAQRFAAKFGPALTKKKLGQFVPVAGMVVGAGLNSWVIDQISVAAHDAYRERSSSRSPSCSAKRTLCRRLTRARTLP